MEIKTRIHQSKNEIFDVVRKQWVALTPEEKVRQFTIHKLANLCSIPLCRMAVERKIMVNGTTKRFDLAIFNPDGTLQLIVECKAPNIKLTNNVITQVLNYNKVLHASYVMITNGIEEGIFSINLSTGEANPARLENISL